MYTDKNGSVYYKISPHIHTTISDGRRTPEQLCTDYKAAGYDAVVLTDHWKYGEEGDICGLFVLSGCEYNHGGGDTTVGVMHILGIGMKRDPKISRDATSQQIVDGILAEGGIAVLAHPAWSLNSLDDVRDLHGIAFTEIYNAVSEVHESLRPYSDHFLDLAANNGFYYGVLACDDAHFYDGSDDKRGWIMVKSDGLTREAVLEALKRGDFYATQGPHINAFIEDGKLIIECSPSVYIGTLSNLSWGRGRVLRGKDLTRHEYLISPDEKWIRAEVCDEQGKRAWSNIFVL